MAEIEVVARYRRIGVSPFRYRFGLDGDFVRIVTEVEDSMPQEELERYAREATPKGYEFLEVIRGDR